MSTSTRSRPSSPPSSRPTAPPTSKRARGEAALRKFHDEEDLERVYDLRMLVSLWPLLRPERAYFYGATLLLMLMAAFGLVRPLIMREVLASFQTPEGPEMLTQLGLLLAGVIAIEQVLAFPQMYWMQLAGARAMARLRSKVFAFLHTRSLAFFDRTPIGRLVTRVTNDVDAIGEMFASGALNAFGDLVRLVAIVAIMLSIDWEMSLFAFAVLPPVMLAVNWTRKRMRTAYRIVRSKTARMNAYLNEEVSGIDVVQAYAREKKSEAVFDDINNAYRDANMRAIVLDATLDAVIEMMGSFCIAAVLWYAGARSVVDFATLFTFVAYIDMFFMPVRNLSQRYTQIQSALAGAERVFELLENDEEDARAGIGEEVDDEAEVAFRLEDVTFGYKPGVPVLEEVTLEARRGQTIAIVGPTGSGKSTIASLLLRLYEVEEGRVEVFGRDVRELSRSALRSQFAVVPQDVFLFPGTIAENIAAGEPRPDLARVQEVLETMGADDLLEREGGLEAPVEERGGNFSQGERQLIAFARALYRNPPLLILDEPTASIDSSTEARLSAAMKKLQEGRTALTIAHRLATIRSADRIVCLHQGRVIEQGTHDELIELDGVYARLYRLQVARKAIADKVEELASVGA